ncbi:hypothetical protein LEP1GSC041_1862 [Leptospira noguchii str. 2006001870]|nr:hypothetical protein LEP1GSC041_1862 [Leptospira noguchii str. 2006001870]
MKFASDSPKLSYTELTLNNTSITKERLLWISKTDSCQN